MSRPGRQAHIVSQLTLGVSRQRGSENGSLRLFSLWEGVILSFNRIDTQVWPLAQAEANNILLLNCCQKGRCEVALDDPVRGIWLWGHSRPRRNIAIPEVSMGGLNCFLDLDALSRRPYPLFQESEVSPEEIMEHLHTHRRLYLASTPPTVQTALDELWQLRDSQELGLIKLLSARLLWEVKRQPVEASPSIRYFTRSQVAIARETREILCADLSRNHTARELAERFQVSETSLKNYFRGVFGKIYPSSCGRHGCAGRQSCCGTPNCGWPRSRHRWATKIKANSRRSLPGSSAAHRWNIAEGHGSIEPCPFPSGFRKVLPPHRSAATGRSRSGAPPCGGRGRPAPSAPPGRPAGPHGRHPAPRCGRLPPRYASCGR